MFDWKELKIEDKPFFDRILKQVEPEGSEMTFTHLYMWRKDYNLRYTIIDDMLCMLSNSASYVPFCFAPVPLDGVYEKWAFRNVVFKLKEFFSKQKWDFLFARIEEKFLEIFKNFMGSTIKYKKHRDTCDYIYLAERLISLKGKKLSSKRNHINKFMREYGEYRYIPMESKYIDECKKIYEKWFKINGFSERSPEFKEKEACYAVLDNWDVLDQKGALIEVNGSFEAFTIGEKLNSNTAVIHIEKANPSMKGLYAIINRDFCKNTWSHLKYINREEDMGLEGLRKSKKSYNPEKMICKYTVKLH